MDDAHGTFHGSHIGNFHKVVQAHGGNGDGIRDGGLKFHIPAKNVQAFHGEAAKAGYFHGSRGHYLMRHKKHAPNEQFSEGQQDYLPPDATPVTMAGPVIAPLVQFREEVVGQFSDTNGMVHGFFHGTHNTDKDGSKFHSLITKHGGERASTKNIQGGFSFSVPRKNAAKFHKDANSFKNGLGVTYKHHGDTKVAGPSHYSMDNR